MGNLVTELLEEIERVQKVKKQYEALRDIPGVIPGPALSMIAIEVMAATEAIAAGDAINCLRSLKSLKEIK